MHASGSTNELSVEAVVTVGNCPIFSLIQNEEMYLLLLQYNVYHKTT